MSWNIYTELVLSTSIKNIPIITSNHGFVTFAPENWTAYWQLDQDPSTMNSKSNKEDRMYG